MIRNLLHKTYQLLTRKNRSENLFNTRYTRKQLENDLAYHDEQMQRHEKKFERHGERRRELLKDAAGSSGLEKNRLVLAANKEKKKAVNHLQKFFAHFEKYQQKMDWDTVTDVSKIKADAEAEIPVHEISDQVVDHLDDFDVETEDESVIQMEKAVNEILESNDMQKGLEEERRVVQQLEEGHIESDEVDLEMQVDRLREVESEEDILDETARRVQQNEKVQ